MKDLTDKQQDVFIFIQHFLSENSFPPTIREIAEQFTISVKGAYDHVKAVEKKGYIKLGENKSRSITIIKQPDDLPHTCLPIIGTVAAGKPIFAEENFEGTVFVPEDMVKGYNCFALKVKGDSMRDVGIISGDIAIIEKRSSAIDGEIVVALVDDSATLKRFFKETSRIRLQSENIDYPPIFSQDVKILGRLKGIVRKY